MDDPLAQLSALRTEELPANGGQPPQITVTIDIDGLPPASIDPTRTPRRNPYHQRT